MIQIPWLTADSLDFPPSSSALAEPDGLLAAGGDLSPARLLSAYRRGIFPWFEPGQPILWWTPNPRTVVFPDQLHISHSLRKVLRRGDFTVTSDRAFAEVMQACAAPRAGASGTWIGPAMIDAYTELHQMGYAHSVEVWRDEQLVGGLYGLVLGKVFFGESMFSRADNASKVAFTHLARQLAEWRFAVLDCQVASDHLFTLGAQEIAREDFEQILLDCAHTPSLKGPWSLSATRDW
ncbi:leucyl/phenylalanyl-tRNA--protein transferase [Marinimicrobium sp. ABcell2]|uniref:leucyl/phenylalanyl-tRNA--protein transferase n=1 Tax=Marinimicrobium sp. ABcell2 TaxID=3069751 RepID=UPI0027B51125|nr:leucyl/phenylalanyl-tRNA--protein transferase [Marinimicrobium sp. ABcell2]MDQ2075444.1 leucyl/phenylalanyl-tRNA--protein transferase [Marinimicrobium sp. ABcell2]